jgi:hypothetical protein
MPDLLRIDGLRAGYGEGWYCPACRCGLRAMLAL